MVFKALIILVSFLLIGLMMVFVPVLYGVDSLILPSIGFLLVMLGPYAYLLCILYSIDDVAEKLDKKKRCSCCGGTE